MSGYDTQYGAGMMTSSPGSSMRLRQVVEALFAAARHQDLVGRIVQAVVALELVDDRLFQAGRAVHRRVFGLAVGDRLARGLLDVLRGIEVRLAGTQADHVFAFGTQRRGAGGDGQSRGGLDRLNAAGKLDAHGLADWISVFWTLGGPTGWYHSGLTHHSIILFMAKKTFQLNSPFRSPPAISLRRSRAWSKGCTTARQA